MKKIQIIFILHTISCIALGQNRNPIEDHTAFSDSFLNLNISDKTLFSLDSKGNGNWISIEDNIFLNRQLISIWTGGPSGELTAGGGVLTLFTFCYRPTREHL